MIIMSILTVLSGKPSLGNMMSAASMMIKAVAAYIAITLKTFLRFSSCQNWNILFGLSDIRVCMSAFNNNPDTLLFSIAKDIWNLRCAAGQYNNLVHQHPWVNFNWKAPEDPEI
jgi:hypothetical protein